MRRHLSKPQANGVLLVVAIIWGSGYVFTKQATLAGLQAGTINAIRGLIYAGLAYLFFHRIINHASRAEWRLGLIAGVINFVAYQLQTVGLMYTSPANSAFLTAIYVVMIPFIVWLVWRRKPERVAYVAIVLCMIGMGFLTGAFAHGLALHFGDVITLISAVAYAGQIVFFGEGAAKASPWVVSFLLGLTQGTLGTVWALLFERGSFATIDWAAGLWPVVVLGVCSSFGAQTLQLLGQRYTDPTPAGLILMLEALFGTVFSVLLGFEPLTAGLVIGGALIVVALVIMQVGFGRLGRMVERLRQINRN